MATLLLAGLGGTLGGAFGPLGAALGQAAGALAGNMLDNALLTPRRTIEGPRLSTSQPFSADEGTPVPRIYGTARVTGALIWATRFEEEQTTERSGGKAFGGPTIRSYSYFANVAFGLCEGEISHVRRIWADGREIDQTGFDFRLYPGTSDQLPDPLILAKQGSDNCPAYRGTAYIVFERMALEQFGNRIPQLQFEVVRPVGRLEHATRAMCIIPGSTEYGYDPERVTADIAPGETAELNRNALSCLTDWQGAMDELQSVAPNLEHCALVSAWFGDDLRASHCKIRPCVDSRDKHNLSKSWKVGSVDRQTAREVSRHNGGAAYGGSPSDASLLAAMADIRARGLSATIYPFIMMDIPDENALPDPQGGASQPPYPWRGRITCHPAAGQPGSPDKSAQAGVQVAAFMGNAQPGDFSVNGTTLDYHGDPDDFGYRRFILHHAHLAAMGQAGAILIGSELRGLTGIRSGSQTFPFVDALIALLADVRQIVGPGTRIAYAADWSEYFGHQPADGSGDVVYHLDPLWAHPELDAIGIDFYMPLADWRDDHGAGTSPDGMRIAQDRAAMVRALGSGEGYDWYYASGEDRARGIRTPITDGAYYKDWVFRFKDIASWWSQPHVNRIYGVEQPAPTAWQPKSKPVWLTEVGCPAIDKGANQPNVFGDPKSSESALPHFSNGTRDDLVQRAYLEAVLFGLDPANTSFQATANPVSDQYPGRMIDLSRIHLWAWDARPFPAFPLQEDVWSDGPNWQLGHWLNGRLGTISLEDLLQALAEDFEVGPVAIEGCDAWMAGYVVGQPTSFRDAVEPALAMFNCTATEDNAGIRFFGMNTLPGTVATISDLALNEDAAQLATIRTAQDRMPTEALLSFADPMRDYQAAMVRAQQAGQVETRQHLISAPVAMDRETATGVVARWLDNARESSQTVHFELPPQMLDLEAGDVVNLAAFGRGHYRVHRIEDRVTRRVEARAVPLRIRSPLPTAGRKPPVIPKPRTGKPVAWMFDPPAGLVGSEDQPKAMIAAMCQPWHKQAVLPVAGTKPLAVLSRPATIGLLESELQPGASGRWLPMQDGLVRLFGGALQSQMEDVVLGGSNRAAIFGEDGVAEIIQFRNAEEIAPGLWRISGLIRGADGTDDRSATPWPIGSRFVLIDDAATTILAEVEMGMPMSARVCPLNKPLDPLATVEAGPVVLQRAALPPMPVHLRATWTINGTLRAQWIRQGRREATSWLVEDIPLGEDAERYLVQVVAEGIVRRNEIVTVPEFLYPPASRAEDGLDGLPFLLKVGQLGRLAGVTLMAEMHVEV